MKEKLKVISVVSDKGGVGKSTTALYIACILSKKKKVLLIDLDNQNSLTRYFVNSHEKIKKKTVFEALLGKEDIHVTIKNVGHNLDFVPSDDLLKELDSQLKLNRDYKLYSILKPIFDRYSFIVIDTPPNIPIHARLAMVFSNYIFIPTELDEWSVESVEAVIRYIEKEDIELRNIIDVNLKKVCIIPTKMEKGRILQNIKLEDLKGKYSDMVLDGITKKEEIRQQKYFKDITAIENTLAYKEYLKILNDTEII